MVLVVARVLLGGKEARRDLELIVTLEVDPLGWNPSGETRQQLTGNGHALVYILFTECSEWQFDKCIVLNMLMQSYYAILT
jgi:hypothetical protein